MSGTIDQFVIVNLWVTVSIADYVMQPSLSVLHQIMSSVSPYIHLFTQFHTPR